MLATMFNNVWRNIERWAFVFVFWGISFTFGLTLVMPYYVWVFT